MCVFLYVYMHITADAEAPEEAFRYPGARVTGGLWPAQQGCWELNYGPL